MITSVCIPRMKTIIKRDFILDVFHRLKVGTIERLQEIPLLNDDTFKRIIIKIRWNDTETSRFIQNRLQQNEPIKLVYDETPYYWKIVTTHQKQNSYPQSSKINLKYLSTIWLFVVISYLLNLFFLQKEPQKIIQTGFNLSACLISLEK